MSIKLPDLIDLDINAYQDELESAYMVYQNQIANGSLVFMDKRVICKKHPVYEGKDFCFWHLITEDADPKNKSFENRIPDFERIKRLAWIQCIIKNHMDENLSCWSKEHHVMGHKSQNRIYLWYEKENYLIVLGEMNSANSKNLLMLITAYCTDREHKKQILRNQRKYGVDIRTKQINKF